MLGDHWNLLLIRQACLGTRRFEDFQHALGIGRNILTTRLNRLVDEGLLHPRRRTRSIRLAPSTGSPRRAATSTRSSRRWLPGANDGSPAPRARPLVLHHTACDHDMHAVVTCSECARRSTFARCARSPARAFTSEPLRPQSTVAARFMARSNTPSASLSTSVSDAPTACRDCLVERGVAKVSRAASSAASLKT